MPTDTSTQPGAREYEKKKKEETGLERDRIVALTNYT
jgi:hypothetical protein